MFEEAVRLCAQYGAKYEYGALMSAHTTFRIGGVCEFFIYANCEELIRRVFLLCKQSGITLHIVGKGSNILVSDNGLNGIVMQIGSNFSEITVKGDIITCQSGALLSRLCKAALDNSLTGLEFAYGIPGTAGGAVFMNAGAYGGEMKDIVTSCRYLDTSGEIREITVDMLELSYRHSYLSDNGGIVLSVSMKLKSGDKTAISARMEELMSRRRDKQPLEYGSAGSTFKRPEGDFAARLIEECGLKGFSCGDAEVSTKHSGFVVNKGNASFDDVMTVVNGVKRTVKEKTGVTLECEMLILE